MSPDSTVGLSVAEVKKNVGAYCCAMKLEAILFQQIQLNNVFAQVLTGFLEFLALMILDSGLIVMYKVSSQNYERGPTFTPECRAEIYRMYLDSIISIAA